MQLSKVNQYFGNVDIYLLDLILKHTFQPEMKVLDAGCGEGRNLMYFLNAGFTVFGVDKDTASIEALRFVAASMQPDSNKEHFQVAHIDQLPYNNDSFDFIIASAVLHFARDSDHFRKMFAELIRCLKPGGILFARMTSDIGIEKDVIPRGAGRYLIPDGTERFLLTRKMVDQLIESHHLKFIEPLKTVNVDGKRCMTTLVARLTL